VTDIGLGSEEPAAGTPASSDAAPATDPAPAPSTETPPAGGVVTGASAPGDASSPASDSGAAVPPTAPTPTAVNDKKTVMILAGVAVVLIVAIAVLYFM
jgi:hypothetical protein